MATDYTQAEIQEHLVAENKGKPLPPVGQGFNRVFFSGTITEYAGKPVTPEIEYFGYSDNYTNIESARSSEDWPNESGILKMVNQKLVAAAKASKYQESTKKLKEDHEKSPEFKLANLVKALRATGKSETEAKALAESFMA